MSRRGASDDAEKVPLLQVREPDQAIRLTLLSSPQVDPGQKPEDPARLRVQVQVLQKGVRGRGEALMEDWQIRKKLESLWDEIYWLKERIDKLESQVANLRAERP